MGQWRQAATGAQKFPRVATAVPVRIATIDAETDPGTGQAFYRNAEETTANLSRGGAYVRSWEPLSAGRRVLVTITLPDEPELQLEARVVWTRREIAAPSPDGALEPAGYGVEFVGGTRVELEALDRYLKRFGAKGPVQPRPAATALPPTP